MNYPKYILNIGNKLYCILLGELDKEFFDKQCEKCTIREKCTIKQSYTKKVALDWHGINATALYGKEFTEEKDSYKKKAIRNIAKGCGLALTYGGSAYTIAKSMGISKEEAQVKIDNFFRTLTAVKAWMLTQCRNVFATGKVYNLFGRMRDVSKDAFSQDRKDRGYAERTAYNAPIQGLAADILKIATIRAIEWMIKNETALLLDLDVPQKIDLKKNSYKDIKMAIVHSVHDETVNMVNTLYVDECIPSVYQEMQLKDITKSIGVNFTFELDCEYDEWGSWTAKEAYPSSKIFLLNLLRSGVILNKQPNTILINFNDINEDILSKLEESSKFLDENLVYLTLGVEKNNVLYFHENKFTLDYIKELNLNYRLCYTEER